MEGEDEKPLKLWGGYKCQREFFKVVENKNNLKNFKDSIEKEMSSYL